MTIDKGCLMNNGAMKVNYQLKLDEITKKLEGQEELPSILLHSCCGPCSSYVVTYLMQWFDITVLYYNPNIYPEQEYEHRLAEQARLLKELNVPLIHLPYDHQEYLDYVRGLEGEPEGGVRCAKCFELRLLKTRELAAERGFDYFATTLTVSPHKNAAVINRIGEALSIGKACPGSVCTGDGKVSRGSACGGYVHETDVHGGDVHGTAAHRADACGGDEDIDCSPLWLPSDFKKRDGYKKSIALSKQYGLYRQDYCGCEFAMEHS